MKPKLSKILAFLLLLSFSVETAGSLWFKQVVSTELNEKDEKGKSNESEPEKDDCKDKIAHKFSLFTQSANSCSLFVSASTFVKYAAWLSMPEIPPEAAA